MGGAGFGLQLTCKVCSTGLAHSLEKNRGLGIRGARVCHKKEHDTLGMETK